LRDGRRNVREALSGRKPPDKASVASLTALSGKAG